MQRRKFREILAELLLVQRRRRRPPDGPEAAQGPEDQIRRLQKLRDRPLRSGELAPCQKF